MSTRFPRTASKYNVQLIDFTPLHQQALDIYGITMHHRKSFAPIKKIINRL